MRVIKFRFFKNGKLLGTAELNRKTQIVDVPYEWDEVSQFTGLLDKSGKEILENDLLKWDGDVFEVRFINAAWELYHIGDPSFDRSALGQVIKPSGSNVEVIGNVFESNASV